MPKRLATFLARLLLFFGPTWVFFTFLGAPAYRHVLAAGCAAYYQIEGKKFFFEVRQGRIDFGSNQQPQFEAQLDPKGVYANTVFLIALILATPGMRPDRRAQRLGIAIMILFLSHIFFLVTKVELSLTAASHPLAGSTAFWSFWDDFFEIVGKVFFPVAIWLLLGLNFMLGDIEKMSVKPRSLKLGRNQPCPCGSGKKYKYCCGKSI